MAAGIIVAGYWSDASSAQRVLSWGCGATILIGFLFGPSLASESWPLIFLGLATALFVDAPWRLALPGTTTLLAIGGLALFSTTVAYFLYFSLIARAGATNTLLVTLLIPVTAILLGTLLLGEVLLPRHWVGMALIAAGLVAIDGRLVDRFWLNRLRV